MSPDQLPSKENADRETEKERLIRQLRTALNDLQSPSYFDYNSSLEFDIMDTTFELTEEAMAQYV